MNRHVMVYKGHNQNKTKQIKWRKPDKWKSKLVNDTVDA